MKELLSKKGGRFFLLGNEAIVRGALESGVWFVSAYPGTPSSEIIDRFYDIKEEVGIRVEYAVNEKVSVETAASFAVSGLRSLCSMKHVGLNVAADAFMTLAYVGVNAGMVIVTADDPSLHSSQNEQDNRFYARMALVPMLEPSTPEEAYKMVKKAFEISEKYKTPCLLRTTTRVNHSRGVVVTEDLPDFGRSQGSFKKDPFRYVVVPMVGRRLRLSLLERLEGLKEEANGSEFNRIEGEGSLGIITSGVSYLYVKDALKELNLQDKVKILKLSMTFPFPEKVVGSFLKSLDKVLIVEELEPYLEEMTRITAQSVGWRGTIEGKKFVPRNFELNVALVKKAIAEFLGIKDAFFPEPVLIDTGFDLPPRPPNLCPGCPHRATYYSLKKVFGQEAIYPTDIGCYTLGFLPPLSVGDFLICMGSSVSTAGGFSVAQEKPVVGVVGDSTFFHAGIPGLINSVFNGHRFLLVILDNATTAMTGHQPHPGVSMTKEGVCEPKVRLEDVVRSCGVKEVEIVNPLNIRKTIDRLTYIKERSSEEPGVYVVISRSPCPLLERRALKKKQKLYFEIDSSSCDGCRKCLDELACPAFFKEGEVVKIDKLLCIGCAVCAQICDAIKPKRIA